MRGHWCAGTPCAFSGVRLAKWQRATKVRLRRRSGTRVGACVTPLMGRAWAARGLVRSWPLLASSVFDSHFWTYAQVGEMETGMCLSPLRCRPGLLDRTTLQRGGQMGVEVKEEVQALSVAPRSLVPRELGKMICEQPEQRSPPASPHGTRGHCHLLTCTRALNPWAARRPDTVSSDSGLSRSALTPSRSTSSLSLQKTGAPLQC